MPEYSIPPWLVHPGEDFANTELRARQLRGEEGQRKFSQGVQSEEMGLREQENDREQQKHDLAVKAIAAKTAADKQFEDDFSKLDPSTPDYNKQVQRLIIRHGTQTADIRGMGAALNALRPVPEAGFTPFPSPAAPNTPTPPNTSPGPTAPATDTDEIRDQTDGQTGESGPHDYGVPIPPSVAPSPAPAISAPAAVAPASFPGGIVRDARGGVHVIPPKYAPNPPRAVPSALKPGEIGYLNGVPYGTNTIPKVADREMVVPPGGVVWKGGQPAYTNMNFKVPAPTKAAASAIPTGKGKPLDKATASKFLQKAGGDKDKARQLARDAGYTF